MAQQTFTYPFTSDTYRPAAMSMRVEDDVLVSRPLLGGLTRRIEIPGTSLVASITYGVQTFAERREIFGWWAKAGLKRNTVLLYHAALPAPAGSMRGSPLVAAATAAGAEAVPFKSMTGDLKRGDLIALTDGLHVVVDDVTPSGGLATVNISPGLRAAVALDSAVVWDRPTGSFMCLSAPDVPFIAGRDGQPGFTVQLVEV